MGEIRLGFIGLGQMGAPMAVNIAAGEFPLTVYDKSGTGKAGTAPRAPGGAGVVASVAEVAAAADTVFLSLPDGADTLSVARDLVAAAERRTTVVVDLSTIGPEAALKAAGVLEAAGVAYVDAPVSGGRAGAERGTITLMWAGPGAELERHRPVLRSFCGKLFHVGDRPGQGQALKLINNFLSATAMAATSEGILYGLSQGLDMKTMLEVINVSTGLNTASRDKFPQRVLTGTFDAGFKTALLAKDVRLFVNNARAAGAPDVLGTVLADLWEDCDRSLRDSDFTRIHEFIRDRKTRGQDHA